MIVLPARISGQHLCAWAPKRPEVTDVVSVENELGSSARAVSDFKSTPANWLSGQLVLVTQNEN